MHSKLHSHLRNPEEPLSPFAGEVPLEGAAQGEDCPAAAFRVVEHFVSVNGEGLHAGRLALFVRFAGCNLACSYCDTRWANEPDCPYEVLDANAICALADQAGVVCVTLTGGEPLLQPGIEQLIRLLAERGFDVELETNGSVNLAPFVALRREWEQLSGSVRFTVDYKTPTSGMNGCMHEPSLRLLGAADCIKCVCGSREDLERSAEVLAAQGVWERDDSEAPAVLFSPVFGQIEPTCIVDFMKERRLKRARVQLQLHKFIWPADERGV